MKVPASIDTGFEIPGDRLRRLQPTSIIIHHLKTNEEVGREVNMAAARSMETFKELGYWIALHDFHLMNNKDRERALLFAREVTVRQRNMQGLSEKMVKIYDHHLANLDWLLKITNKGWAQQMFPMLDHD